MQMVQRLITMINKYEQLIIHFKKLIIFITFNNQQFKCHHWVASLLNILYSHVFVFHTSHILITLIMSINTYYVLTDI